MHASTGQTYPPAARRRRLSSRRPVEPLESRILWAIAAPITLAVGNPVNITRFLENQNEASIAIDRTDPGNLFMASVNDARTGPLDDVDLDLDGEADPPPLLRADTLRGLVGARSTDGGATWVSGTLDTDEEDDPDALLPPACCDPSVAYDEFGNLFATFLNRNTDQVIVSMSSDRGRTFDTIATFTSEVIDQPTVVTGAGTVWVSFNLDGHMVASGARVLGLGAISDAPREKFDVVQEAPRSDGGNFGDIAIGPNGEVMIAYQILTPDADVFFDPEDGFVLPSQRGPADIYVNVDPDGLGAQGFGPRNRITRTAVGTFDAIPAQAGRTIDAEAGLAWDRSGGPFNGRVWSVYTDEAQDEAGSNTDIFVRFSDDMGKTWSTPRIVTDEDVTTNSQFLPRIAIDQTTGNIAVVWHDTRMQNGISFGPNDETQFFGTVGVPTIGDAGVAFAANVQISDGFSDASRSRAILEYGDYTGLDFHNNVFYPVWGDNSNSTGDNPSGGVDSPTALATFDVYTAKIVVTPLTQDPPQQAPVGPGSPLKPDFVGKQTVTRGKLYRFRVVYESASGVNVASLGDDDLLITGPNGYNLFADFIKAKRGRRGTLVTGTYQTPAPGGAFDQGDNGLYSILLQNAAVSDSTGVTTDTGLLDQFLVSSTIPRQPISTLPESALLQPAGTNDDAGGDDDNEDKLKAVGL